MSAAELTALPQRSLTRDEYDRYVELVRRIALRLLRRLPKTVSLQDLVGCGWVGLLEAHRRAAGLSPEELEAYASHRVRGAMLDHLRSLDTTSRRMRTASRRLARAVTSLVRELGREPTEAEIAAALELDLPAYHALLGQIAEAGMARLEIVDEWTLESLPSNDDAPDDIVGRDRVVERIATAIDVLPPRLRQVLALYYQEGCTLKEIGAVLGVTESRVSQLHTEAMHRLRAAIGRE